MNRRIKIKVVDSEHLDFPDEWSAEHEGKPFTGYSMEKEDGYTSFQFFVSGSAHGPDYIRTKSGSLVSYGDRTRFGCLLGASYDWDAEGNLVSETIKNENGLVCLDREWDSTGILLEGGDRTSRSTTEGDPGLSGDWIAPPPIVKTQNARSGNFSVAVESAELDISSENGALILGTGAFTGRVFHHAADGRREARTVVDGFEHGSVLMWSPSGRLVTQGVRCYPHGPVGPWHEWDEEGRLLRETVYDALGNRIIVRELDEHCDIVKQEKFAPAKLLTDPETGEERPAPWL